MGGWNDVPMRCQLVDIPGAQNVRDIGGYLGAGGKPVRGGKFIRAGSMSALTDEGVAVVRALRVGCIVDLRSQYEVEHRPDTLMGDPEIDFVHISMLDYINSAIDSGTTNFPSSMTEMYIGLLENDKDQFFRLMQVFGDPAYEAVIYHCTAGKDRTGLATMLLLGLAGVSRADIVEDYTYSERFQFESMRNTPDLPRHVFEANPKTMETSLDHLDRHYGGVRGYLRHIGMDGDLEAALLEKLL